MPLDLYTHRAEPIHNWFECKLPKNRHALANIHHAIPVLLKGKICLKTVQFIQVIN